MKKPATARGGNLSNGTALKCRSFDLRSIHQAESRLSRGYDDSCIGRNHPIKKTIVPITSIGLYCQK
jgi:hypothetical protein